MGKFFFESTHRKIARALENLGFSVTNGKRHDQIHCEQSGKKCPLPRHRKIKSEIVDNIAKFILECDPSISEEELQDLLK